MKRYREKRSRRETGRRANGNVPAEPQFSADQLERMVVKSKHFELRPMSAEEAALQLELVGHDFVFENEDTGATNVVYRRRDGGYGHIEPQA